MEKLFGSVRCKWPLYLNKQNKILVFTSIIAIKKVSCKKKLTVKDSLTVQKEGKRTVNRKLELYNLDVIISVGYRVKSKQGTQFRQWATQRLNDYLVKGYAINEKRLAEAENRFSELKQAIQLFDKVAHAKEISGSEAQGFLSQQRLHS